MLIRTGLPRAGPLARCILKAQEVTTKVVYRLPHGISTAVASPCQTLRELLAGDHELTHTNSPAHQLVVSRMRSSPRVCTLVLFHFLHNSILCGAELKFRVTYTHFI